MLRLALGFGGSSASEDNTALGDLTLSGFSGFFSIDLGGALSESFILHGRISSMAMVDPSVSRDGEKVGEAEDSSLTWILIGLGATYYFMPANIYVTGVIALADATAETPAGESSSDTGFGLELDLGKEWWVHEQWGLGLAGRFMFSRVPDQSSAGDSVALLAFGGGLLFSVTFN